MAGGSIRTQNHCWEYAGRKPVITFPLSRSKEKEKDSSCVTNFPPKTVVQIALILVTKVFIFLQSQRPRNRRKRRQTARSATNNEGPTPGRAILAARADRRLLNQPHNIPFRLLLFVVSGWRAVGSRC